MNDETETGSAEVRDVRGGVGGGACPESPLQARAAFLANWGWELVVRYNRGMCERGSAQHGFNSESQEASRRVWEAERGEAVSLKEAFDKLRTFHRRAPFLFFNGNTFAMLGATIAKVVFSELPPARLREVVSIVSHYIAGVVYEEDFIAFMEEFCAPVTLHPGDAVKTLKGSLSGVVLEVYDDGRVRWRSSQGGVLIVTAESIIKIQPAKGGSS